MINPVTVMKVVNERKAFLDNHPEFFRFLLEQFGSEGVSEGTVIEMKVTRPGQQEVKAEAELVGSDMKLFSGLKEMIR